MFESIGNHILKGIITFGLLVFSSYEGNDASFRSLRVNYYEGLIGIELNLDGAFENDFEEIFKTGKSIDIWFKVDVSSQGVVLEEELFSHNVTYDPLLDSYLLKRGSTDDSIICSSYNNLKEELSLIIWDFRRLRSVDDYDLSITAYMEKIYFSENGDDFNLMLLWKNKTPRFKQKIRVN
ncbi:hypothetical protein JEZ13_03675 [bacterium]|nr:hypothetical protein [bacterium]